MANLIKKWNTDTNISWWNECRTELNKAIEAYNLYVVDDITGKEAHTKIALAYAEIQNQPVDYTEDFGVIISYLRENEFPCDWYHGF